MKVRNALEFKGCLDVPPKSLRLTDFIKVGGRQSSLGEFLDVSPK